MKENFLVLERSLSLSSASPTTDPSPLIITLSGLFAGSLGSQDPMVKCLLAKCDDPTSRISHMLNNLAIIFASAGVFDLS